MDQLYTTPFKAMGSLCELKLYTPDAHTNSYVSGLAIKEVRRLEEKYTRFKPESITSKINSEAGNKKPVSIDRETFQLLNYANALYEQSDEMFDITSGVLRRAWDFRSGRLPDKQTLAPLLQLVGWPKVILSDSQVELPVEGMQIDFGGFVKEYAADLTAAICLKQGIAHGLINLGGDIRLIGPHPDNSPWKIGITHPRKPNTAIATIKASSGGVATSGDYERFMIVDGKRYCHLLNPETGHSIRPKFASVSILADTCLIAGSFSSTAILTSENGSNLLEDVGLSYLIVDQEMQCSGSIESY